jgi:hypothetical protein
MKVLLRFVASSENVTMRRVRARSLVSEFAASFDASCLLPRPLDPPLTDLTSPVLAASALHSISPKTFGNVTLDSTITAPSMSTFRGIVAEFPQIRIDYFRQQPEHKAPLACFLSHVHSDHLTGLESMRAPFVYCSAATKEVIGHMLPFC